MRAYQLTGGTPGPDTQPPTVPVGLRATGTTADSASLAWNAATDDVGVTGYEVYRGTTLTATVSGTTYTDTGLAAATPYSYTVRARDAAGNRSAASTPLTVTTAQAPGTVTLLSQGRPTTASSTEGPGFEPALAVDGQSATRWASAEGSDPQWIRVDLGAAAALSRVRLDWEAAYASAYRIQSSADGATWTDLATVTGGDGGTDDIAVTGDARYVRVYGTQRATPYGYSLYELKVYGTTGSPSPTPAPTQTPSPTPTPTSSSSWQAGVAYAVGDQVTYNGNGYRCLQAHTSQQGWEPSTSPALWERSSRPSA
ncbi:discoidin domain-containing protein [Streptomyces sp. NPDC057854]|uniref:discoidin domain-containing protein n=1 Tax=unclassified Streptomyces TaxID=2593676 RepID=UPI0036AB2D15